MAIHPVGIKNTFGSHLVLWALFLPLLAIIFLPLVLPEQNIEVAEVEMVKSFDVDVSQLTASASATFTKVFIDSGLMPRSERFFSGAGDPTAKASSVFAAKWIHGVWMMVYKAIWRFYVLIRIFFMPLIALSIPAAIDGFCIRSRKRYQFLNSNPVFFYSSMHLVVLMVGLFIFLPLAPFTLSATVLCIMLLGTAGGMWLTAANFQTGS